LEEATFLVVQDGRKNTGRIKVWQAAPVDRAIDSDQSDRVEIADHTVALYGFVAHRASSCHASFDTRSRQTRQTYQYSARASTPLPSRMVKKLRFPRISW